MVLCLLAYTAAVLAAVYYAVTTIVGKFKISGASRKAVLITGCDTGFGRLAALKCLREGMVVFAGCLHGKSVKELEESASEAGGSLVAFELDVTSDDSVASAKQLVEGRVSKHNGLHAVINNAGTARVGFNDWIDVDDYKSMMDVDLFGTVRVNQALLPLLKKSRGGRIVNVSAFLGRFAFPGFGPYNTAKHAIGGYTDTLRRELAPFGIRVITLHPGWHRTPMGSPASITAAFEQAWKKADPEVREEYGEHFIERLTSFTAEYLRSSCNSPQPESVAEAYYHAIASVWPKKSYTVGPLAPYVSLISVLPDFVQDYAWDVVASAVRHPKPALAALRPAKLPVISEQQVANDLVTRVSDVRSKPEIWPIYEQEYKRPCTKTPGTASIDKPSRKKEKAGTLPRTPKPRQRVRRQSLFSVI